MMQGDACLLAIRILNNAGTPLTPADIQDVEITIGGLCKRYCENKLSYADGLWLFPLSQQETFGNMPGAPQAQVRVKWANGVIEGQPLYGIRIRESISREVL